MPNNPTTQPDHTHVENDKARKMEDHGTAKTEREYENSPSSANNRVRFLQHWENKISQQTSLLSIGNLSSVRERATILKEYCHRTQDTDPMISALIGSTNPFLMSKKKAHKPQKRQVTVSDVRVWVNCFPSLLNDAEGLACFRVYLQVERESNTLEFWEAVHAQDSIATRMEFIMQAIYRDL